MEASAAPKKPGKALCKQLLVETIPDIIHDQNYSNTTVEFLTNKITQTLGNKFKELQYENYKFIFHVLLTEQRGQGLRAHTACYWDETNDVQMSMTFQNVKQIFGFTP